MAAKMPPPLSKMFQPGSHHNLYYTQPKTMNAPNVNDFINSRNGALWTTLNNRNAITLEHSPDNTYGCFTKNGTATIYIPDGGECRDSFTHELLHVYFHYEGMNIGKCLKMSFLCEETLTSIYSDELLDHISNCLEHQKMLPIYLNMGFNREKFLSDYSIPICDVTFVKSLGQLLAPEISYWPTIANVYIGKFFAVKASPNDSIDYSECLTAFQEAEPRLFTILNTFWTAWDSFSLDDMETVSERYRSLCSAFIVDLKDWVVERM
jgi:hypothetical protein